MCLNTRLEITEFTCKKCLGNDVGRYGTLINDTEPAEWIVCFNCHSMESIFYDDDSRYKSYEKLPIGELKREKRKTRFYKVI
jgi:hypothetical protein